MSTSALRSMIVFELFCACFASTTAAVDDKMCVTGSVLSYINGAYDYHSWDSTTNGSVYYNSKTDQYLYPWIYSYDNKDYLISSDPSRNVVNSFCHIPSTTTTAKLLHPDDCYNANGDQWTSYSSSWFVDNNLRVVHCEDVCISSSAQSQINGIYEWIAFDADLATSVYFCESCNLYLFGWVFENNNNYQWRIAPNYSDPLSSPMARCKLGVKSAGTYKFDLDDCTEWDLYDTTNGIFTQDQTLSVNTCNSVAMLSAMEIVSTAATTTTTEAPRQEVTSQDTSIVIKNHKDTEAWWVAFYLLNLDDSCNATIVDVQITDDGYYADEWISVDAAGLQWDQYGFLHQGAEFTLPLSVRIIFQTANNTVNTLYACDIITDFEPLNEFVVGTNLCSLDATHTRHCMRTLSTTMTTSISPTKLELDEASIRTSAAVTVNVTEDNKDSDRAEEDIVAMLRDYVTLPVAIIAISVVALLCTVTCIACFLCCKRRRRPMESSSSDIVLQKRKTNEVQLEILPDRKLMVVTPPQNVLKLHDDEEEKQQEGHLSLARIASGDEGEGNAINSPSGDSMYNGDVVDAEKTKAGTRTMGATLRDMNTVAN